MPRTKSILVLDSYLPVAHSISTFLQFHDFKNVFVAINVAEARNYFQLYKIDLIVVEDCFKGFLEKVAEKKPELKVVFLSTQRAEDYCVCGMKKKVVADSACCDKENGKHCIFCKPVNFDELLECIKRLLGLLPSERKSERRKPPPK